MALSALGNIGEFIQGFAQRRGAIETSNQAEKATRLDTVSTMFDFAEARKKQSDAARTLSLDESLTLQAREQHESEAQRLEQEGERFYSGASELFGMIDEKPKGGKKQNPAMQMLSFLNPFQRRGPGGEQSQQFQELVSSIMTGGGQGGGGGGTPEGGIARATQTPTGSAPTEPTAGQTFAQLPPVGSATGEAMQAGVSPAAAAMAGLPTTTPPPGGAAGPPSIFEPAAPAAPTRGDFTSPGQAVFGDQAAAPAAAPAAATELPTTKSLYPGLLEEIPPWQSARFKEPPEEKQERLAQEAFGAVDNMLEYIITTPAQETFTEALADPTFRMHYNAGRRAVEMGLMDRQAFQDALAAAFPAMREHRPDAGDKLQRTFESELLNAQRANEDLTQDISQWPPKLRQAKQAYDVWLQTEKFGSLTPEQKAQQKYFEAKGTPTAQRTDQQLRDITTWEKSPKAAGGATQVWVHRPMQDPVTGETVMGRFPQRGDVTGKAEVVQVGGKPVRIPKNIDFGNWLVKSQIRNPAGIGFIESQVIDPSLVMLDVSTGNVRPEQVVPLLDFMDETAATKLRDWLADYEPNPYR